MNPDQGQKSINLSGELGYLSTICIENTPGMDGGQSQAWNGDASKTAARIDRAILARHTVKMKLLEQYRAACEVRRLAKRTMHLTAAA